MAMKLIGLKILQQESQDAFKLQIAQNAAELFASK